VSIPNRRGAKSTPSRKENWEKKVRLKVFIEKNIEEDSVLPLRGFESTNREERSRENKKSFEGGKKIDV